MSHLSRRILYLLVFVLLMTSMGMAQVPVPYGDPADNCYAIVALPGQGSITLAMISLQECAPPAVWVWYAQYLPNPYHDPKEEGSAKLSPQNGQMVILTREQSPVMVAAEPGAYRISTQVIPMRLAGRPSVRPRFATGAAPYYETTLVIVEEKPENLREEFSIQPYAETLYPPVVDGKRIEFSARLNGPTMGIFFQRTSGGLISFREENLMEISPNVASVELPGTFSLNREIFGHFVDLFTGVAGTYKVWDPRAR